MAEVLTPMDECEHPIIPCTATPQGDLVYECESCSKTMIIPEHTLKLYQGDIRVLISGVVLLFFGEPWLKEAVRK